MPALDPVGGLRTAPAAEVPVLELDEEEAAVGAAGLVPAAPTRVGSGASNDGTPTVVVVTCDAGTGNHPSQCAAATTGGLFKAKPPFGSIGMA